MGNECPIPRIFSCNIKEVCIKVIEKSQLAEKCEFIDETYNKINYEIIKDEIKIIFENFGNKSINIFKNPIKIKDEHNKELFKIYEKDTLKMLYDKYLDIYEFYYNNKLLDMKALENYPEIILKKKASTLLSNFKPLFSKKIIPENTKAICTLTNELTPVNINSLNLVRNSSLNIIIKNRNELINEFKNFIISEQNILKMYGCDGVGKSISLIYFTSLINDKKIVYFNLKEWKNETLIKKITIIKEQIMQLFADNSGEINKFKDEKDKNLLYDLCFKEYNLFIKELENKKLLEKNNQFNFWNIFKYLIDNALCNNTVFILDQYKIEDDLDHQLLEIEYKFSSEKSKLIKLIISSSINDMEIKVDFLNKLKYFQKAKAQEGSLNEKKSNEGDDLIIFEKFIEETNPKEDITYFDSIKNFRYEEKVDENEQAKIEIEYSEESKVKIGQNMRIIYINDLVSVEQLKDFEKNNEKLIEKMKIFNFNPKYYNKFKEFYYSNKQIPLNQLYSQFLSRTYNHLKNKILKFYQEYCLNLTKNSYEKYTCENLAILVDLIKEKTELNLEQVVFYAEKIPLKYVKINRINSNNGSKDKFFYINENLEESLYYFDYTFPFIEYVIHRIIYDIGNAPNINFSNLSPSAIGSFLENQILRNFADKKRIEKFLIRNVWSFQNIYPKEEKNIEKIDIFNFNIVICDDIKENPLLFFDSNYYIVPQNPINQYLDSVILIPCLSSAQVPQFDLISLQMTIKKKTIYSKKEYEEATISAAKLLERIYKIKINYKYFIFILAKDYQNQSTKSDLFQKNIQFIFYSTTDSCFYLNDSKKMVSVKNLLNITYKVKDENDLYSEETVFYKTLKLKEVETLLQKKRKKDNKPITKKLFTFTRGHYFGNDSSLELDDDLKSKIIEIIKKENADKRNITIEYAFSENLLFYFELMDFEDLIGLIFFKSNIFIVSPNFNIKVISDKTDKEIEEATQRLAFLLLNIKQNYRNKNLNTSPKDKKEISNLLKYNQNAPSDLFVFKIYDILD